MSVNKVTLLGRLGKDPESTQLKDGSNVTRLSLCTQERWTDREGKKQEKATWHRLVCWNALAKVADQYLAKGRLVLIEGKLDNRTYEDKDKITRYVTEIIVQNISFVDSKPKEPEPDKQAKFEYKKQSSNSKKKAA